MWRIQMLQIQSKFFVVLDRSKIGLVCIYLKKIIIYYKIWKKILKRLATSNNVDRSATASQLSQLPHSVSNPRGHRVILSCSTEAKQISIKGKCILKISIFLFHSVPCDLAVYQTPVASIVSFSSPHCSLAIRDGVHSMGWYHSLHDIIWANQHQLHHLERE